MAHAIRAATSEEFPLVLSVMGGAAVFTGMLLPHLDFPLEFDYIHLTRYRNTTKGGDKMQWRVAPAESVKDRVVLVLDDILDEGETMAAIRDRIMADGREAISVGGAVREDHSEGASRCVRISADSKCRTAMCSAAAWMRKATGATCRRFGR